MKIHLIETIDNSPKYRQLYDSVHGIFATNDNTSLSDDMQTADCIVCVGDLTDDIIAHKPKSECSVIRFLFRSDISKYFYTDLESVDFTFWVNDLDNLDINILYPYLETSTKIPVPFDFSNDNVGVPASAAFDIYVNTGEFLYADSALFKILRTLNRLTRLKIDVCSSNESIRGLCNPNITISDSSACIEEHVKSCRMVIGSGYAIMYAIKYRKPFIVLGERGYGGIPTQNNILQFYQEFFQGTIGGRLDGALPENLVYEDIQNIVSDNYLAPNFSRLLSETMCEIHRLIADTATSKPVNPQEFQLNKLKFNTDYTLIEGNGKFWILNRYTRFVESVLNDKCVDIIKSILHKDNIIMSLSHEAADSIKQLIKNKILVAL